LYDTINGQCLQHPLEDVVLTCMTALVIGGFGET